MSREGTVGALKRMTADAVKVGAAGADRVAPPARGVTILLYHQVGGGSGGAVDVAASVFAEQVAWLADRGPIVTLDAALDALAGDAPPRVGQADPVVITFDDGARDFAEHALPVLERHQAPVTLFVATAHLEDGRPFSYGASPLSWGALADAVATGLVTVGSHTHDHLLMDRVDAATAREQLDRSVGLIEERLGVTAEHFAYPKALLPGPAVEAVVRERFRSACLAGTHSNRYGATDAHRLARSPIQAADGMRWFVHKASGGMKLEDRLRQLVVARRYRGSVT